MLFTPICKRSTLRRRKERELAFYGAVVFIPIEEYTADDANQAFTDAKLIVLLAKESVEPMNHAQLPFCVRCRQVKVKDRILLKNP